MKILPYFIRDSGGGHKLLHFIACRVLGSSERADGAIEMCWVRASRNPPRFEYAGAFRSLVRVLIDEALAILRQNRPTVQNEIRLRRNVIGARNQLHEKRILRMKAGTEGEY
jgi:hypothetical protein